MSTEGIPRVAAVGPYAAVWLVAQLRRAGVGSAQVRAHAQSLGRAGYPGLAAELLASWGQLNAAAADHKSRYDAATSAFGSAEVDSAEVAAGSEATARGRRPAGGEDMAPMGWLTSEAAAGLLGVSPRAVTGWLADGVLTGRKVRGRWLADQESVNAIAAERKRAS